MKANIARENYLSFNNFPTRYDQGRPIFDLTLVQNLLQQMDIAENEQILEIGPATGPLTVTLLQCGLNVVAVEPGPQLVSYLQSQPWADEKLQVVCSTFEAFNSEDSFAAIIAANSFHWVDPVVGYQKAYDLLRPDGTLCLLWTFPILADAHLQQQLNDEVFINEAQDFRRQPEEYVALINDSMSQGREELVANSQFDKPLQDDFFNMQLTWSVEQYITFQRSLANGDLISDTVANRIREVLGANNDVLLDNYIAVTLARK